MSRSDINLEVIKQDGEELGVRKEFRISDYYHQSHCLWFKGVDRRCHLFEKSLAH